MTYFTKEESIEFEGEKTLYHYTSIYTAIEKIFPSNNLRLSPVTSASDPMERLSPNPSVSCYGYDEDHKRLNEKIDGKKIAKKINAFYGSLRQLCLCRNSPIDFEGQFGGVFEPIDHFGFAKPRMWDQYGDRFKGVCIALSRLKLEEQLPSNYRLLNIGYSKNHLFRPNIDTSSVDLNQIEKMGEQEYINWKIESEIKKIGVKHSDYRDEDECKIIATTDNDYEYINITRCIQGIFFTNGLNYTYESYLKETADRYQIPLFQIDIRRTGLNVNVFYNKRPQEGNN
ncbi:DUF2971 domain-containing protein [Marinoscillum sp. 108]|uniref:DUF2971 domain-containing protein n=1 Tax=Marinoscillum sp. 108 TaxID=2653151 RepID=UPI0012F39426|nr:DUF2971 domain-containing protein [Marinoscillum sp. 108]VXD11146.1 conserved hypothetical protein [Marinoscillum sp. 108]